MFQLLLSNGGFPIKIIETQISLLICVSISIGNPPSDWIGDGECDDENNNALCNFDGGDCGELEGSVTRMLHIMEFLYLQSLIYNCISNFDKIQRLILKKIINAIFLNPKFEFENLTFEILIYFSL